MGSWKLLLAGLGGYGEALKIQVEQNEIKNTELPGWSCVIWGCLPGSVEQTSLIFDDVSLSLK